mgnify:CR=1 FL=1
MSHFPTHPDLRFLTRRQFFSRCAMGLGGIALASLMRGGLQFIASNVWTQVTSWLSLTLVFLVFLRRPGSLAAAHTLQPAGHVGRRDGDEPARLGGAQR